MREVGLLRRTAALIRESEPPGWPLAVADWLDHEATRFGNVRPQWQKEWADDPVVLAALTDGLFRHPLAVANAYLREVPDAS